MTDFRTLANEYGSAMRIAGKVDSKAFANGIAVVKDTGAKLDARIHALAMACIDMAMPSTVCDAGASNCEPARQLLNAMPKISRAKTLADWFEAHSNIRAKFDKKAGDWKCNLAKKDALSYMASAEKLMEARAAADKQPFFTPEEKTGGAKDFDFAAGLSNFIARAAKSLGNDNPQVAALLALAEEQGVTVTLPKAKAA